MIITEVLSLEDGRCIVRVWKWLLHHEPLGEFVFRLPPIEYTPRYGDEFEFHNMGDDRRIKIKNGPWIGISVNDYFVLSGTCVGMPLTEVFRQ